MIKIFHWYPWIRVRFQAREYFTANFSVATPAGARERHRSRFRFAFCMGWAHIACARARKSEPPLGR